MTRVGQYRLCVSAKSLEIIYYRSANQANEYLAATGDILFEDIVDNIQTHCGFVKKKKRQYESKMYFYIANTEHKEIGKL